MATLTKTTLSSKSTSINRNLTWAIAKNPASLNCEHKVASNFLKKQVNLL
jgi:hypothetical protein